MFLLELIRKMLHNSSIPIHSSQVNIAGRGDRVKLGAFDIHQRDIKRSTAEIVNQYAFFAGRFSISPNEPAIDPERNRGRCRFVDNVEHLDARHPPCVLRRFPAWFVKVCGDGNHRLVEFTDLQFGVRF